MVRRQGLRTTALFSVRWLPLALGVGVACGGSGPVGIPRDILEAEVLWSRPSTSSTGVATAAGRVVAAEGPDVIGLEAADGTEVWRVAVDRFGSFEAEIASDGATVVAFQLATSAALSAADGAVLWRHEERSVGAVPVIDGDRVFGAGRGWVSALDRATGLVVWDRDTGTGRDGLVAAHGSAVCVVTELLLLNVPHPREELLCLDRLDGEIRWRFDDPRLVAPNGLVVHGERVVVGTLDGWILAVDLETGALAWESKLPADLWVGIAASEGTVVACTGERGSPVCRAFRAQHGSVLWSVPVAGTALDGTLVVADGRVWFVDRGALVALDLVTGRLVQGPIGGPDGDFFRGTPAVGDGVAYVRSFGRLYAIRVEP